jgi:general secretion pathway protein L
MILLWLHEDRPRWWQVEAGRIVARGAGAPPPGAAVLAVAPEEAVSLHRVMLPRLAPAQTLAAARAMAAELAAVPVAGLHVAVSAPEAGGERWLALVDEGVMRRCAETLAGLAPEAALVPAPLLLPVPGRLEMDGLVMVRTETAAVVVEAALLPELLPDAPALLDEAQIAAAVPALLAAPPLDLMQGGYGRQRPFRLEAGRVRRLLALAAALALALAGAEAARWWQAARAEAAAVAARDALAGRLLPAGTIVREARAQVEAEARRVLAGDFSARAAVLLAALEARPGVALVALEADAVSLTATLEGASPGDLAALGERLAGDGLRADAGLPRETGGRQLVELKVQPR